MSSKSPITSTNRCSLHILGYIFLLFVCRMNEEAVANAFDGRSGRQARHRIYNSGSINPSSASLFYLQHFHPPHSSFTTDRRRRAQLFTERFIQMAGCRNGDISVLRQRPRTAEGRLMSERCLVQPLNRRPKHPSQSNLPGEEFDI